MRDSSVRYKQLCKTAGDRSDRETCVSTPVSQILKPRTAQPISGRLVGSSQGCLIKTPTAL